MKIINPPKYLYVLFLNNALHAMMGESMILPRFEVFPFLPLFLKRNNSMKYKPFLFVLTGSPLRVGSGEFLTGLAFERMKVSKYQSLKKYQSQVCDWCPMFNNALGRPSSWPGPPSPAYQIKEICWLLRFHALHKKETVKGKSLGRLHVGFSILWSMNFDGTVFAFLFPITHV